MTELQRHFFSRLNIKERETISFEDLNAILYAMAQSVPFENLDIINGNVKEISKENLQEKILIKKRGGICYELNPIMYYFLADCGLDVHLLSGTVYVPASKTWAGDEGHVATILKHNNELYLIEVGFGSFLPLAPVPFSGEVVHSVTGDYRIRKETTEKGTYILEMRNNIEFMGVESSEGWEIGYAFNLEAIDIKKLNQVQKLIVEHEFSPFNKAPLIVRLTDDGHVSLTKTSLTTKKNGTKSKDSITDNQYSELLNTIFGITC